MPCASRHATGGCRPRFADGIPPCVSRGVRGLLLAAAAVLGWGDGLVLAVVVAAWLFSETHERPDMPALPLAVLLLAGVSLLLLLQPDIGQTLLIVAVWGVLYVASGLPLTGVAALAALGTGVLAALVWLGQWTFVELAWTLPLLAAEVLVAMAIGVVLPVSAEQSINGSVSEAATLVLLIALTVGVQSALGSITILPLAIAVQTFVLLGALAGYLLVARAASRA